MSLGQLSGCWRANPILSVVSWMPSRTDLAPSEEDTQEVVGGPPLALPQCSVEITAGWFPLVLGALVVFCMVFSVVVWWQLLRELP